MTAPVAKTLISGIDVAADVRAALPCLVAAKKVFVARYLAISTSIEGKILTPIEAKAISDAGLALVSVWENGPADEASYFNRAHGERDGAYAAKLAQSVGQPRLTPIYFAIDYDASLKDLIRSVKDYVLGVYAGLDDSYRNGLVGTGPYFVGVYGSGLTCAVLGNMDQVTHTWLAEAEGWAGTKEYDTFDIRQTGGAAICGLNCDADVAQEGDYGGWRVQSPTA